MPACSPRGCGCSLTGSGVVGGSGEPGSPYVIDSGGYVTICTSVTRPASPEAGEIIHETDTDRTYVRVSSSWVILADPAPHTLVTQTLSATDITVNTLTLVGTMPTVTVPPWANSAFCELKVSGMYNNTSVGNNVIALGMDGTAISTSPAYAATGVFGSSNRAAASWQGSLMTSITAGATHTPSVWARTTATTLRFDSFCTATAKFTWRI